ncbi:MAG TPA: ATP-binding protein [Anaerolineales bacterium]|nr:ATP-binding protein [Anaerolineales bacterium]
MSVLPETLKRFDLFAGLPGEALEAIALLAQEQTLPDGELLFAEGTSADHLFLIIEGQVSLEKKVQLGRTGTPRRAPIEVTGPWQEVGWSSLVRPYLYTSSGVVQGGARLLTISGEALRQWMVANPVVGYEILQRIAAIIRHRMESSTANLTYFLSVISHEIKRPLAAVESNLQVLLGGYSGPLEEKQRRLLERSSLRLADLRALISDVVDFARMQPSQIRSDFEWIEPGQVMAEAVEEVRLAAQQKSIQLRVVGPARFQPLVAARRRLGQVISNLLANAVKFSPEGRSVVLSAHDEPAALVLEVTDEGIGIPAEDQPHIFEDFFRAQNAEGFGGAGLGLSIAQKIVGAHGGTISVVSPVPPAPGGTRFTLRIPRSPSLPGSAPGAAPVGEGLPAGEPSLVR